VPFDTAASAGQDGLLPLHSSTASHSPALGRQTAPALPAGCVHTLLPLHWSTVHGLLSDVHGVPDVSKASAGQLKLDPSQTSWTSQTPVSARQTVPDGFTPSAGQLAVDPSQFSAASHSCPTLAARHSVPDSTKAFGGHWKLDPSQTSCTSQSPAEARQIVPDGNTPSAGQVGVLPSHCSASSQSWPVLAARHSVPPLPAVCWQSPPPSHSSTVQI
jgi:hypothetical protein